MAIALSGATTGNSGTSQPASIPVTFPGTAAAGDVAVIVLHTPPGAATVTDPSGWTVHANGDGGNTKLGLWSKVLDGADITAGGVTLTRSAGGSYSWECGTWSGSTGFDALSAQQATTTGTTSVTIPAVTPVAANCLRLGVVAGRVVTAATTATASPPGSWTEVGEAIDAHASNQRRLSFLDSIQLVGQAGVAQSTATATTSTNVTYQSYSLTLAPTTTTSHTASASLAITASLGATASALTPGDGTVGLSVAGGEFGTVPGTYDVDYHYDGQASLSALYALGCRHVRIPVKMDRLQPTPGAAFDSAEQTRLTDFLGRISAAGLTCKVEAHNYGRRVVGGTEHLLGSVNYTQAHHADFFSRLAALCSSYGQVTQLGYNEPHDLVGTSGSLAAGVQRYTWETSGTSGWAGEGTATVARTTSSPPVGVGALAATKTLGSGSDNIRINDAATLAAANGNDISGSGATLSVLVQVPAGAPGTSWQARLEVQNSSFVYQTGPWFTLNPGTTTEVFYTPTAGLLSNFRGIAIQFDVINANASVTVKVDQLQQGTLVGGLTGLQIWQAADQAAYDAVRAAGWTGGEREYHASGYAWSSAKDYGTINGSPWIVEGSGLPVRYEAHSYGDNDRSGTYAASFATETTNATGQGYASVSARWIDWVNDFTDWCTTHAVLGVVGEIGWPDDSGWNTAGGNVLAAVTSAGVDATYWAVGEWWGLTYALSPWEWDGDSYNANGQAPVVSAYFALAATVPGFAQGFTGGFGPAIVVPPPPPPPTPSPEALAAGARPIVEIGFSTDPLVSGGVYGHWSDPERGIWGTSKWAPADVWADVTPWLESFSYTRGASRVEGPVIRYEAGTATVVLRNDDGRFHPLHTAGPYVSAGKSQVRPMVPIRIRAVYAGRGYDLWRGFVDPDGWDIQYNLSGDGSTATVTATDAQMVFGSQSRTALPTPVGTNELSGARINRILDSVGWPRTDRIVAAGNTRLVGTVLEGEPWAEMMLVQDTELGALYVNARGKVVFKDRHAVLKDTVSTVPQAIFGRYGNVGELPHAGLVPNSGGGDMRNVIRIARQGGVVQEARDDALIAEFREWTHERTDLLMQTDAEAASYAHYLLSSSKNPDYRFAQIIVNPQAQPAELFPLVFGTDFGWRYTVRQRPPIVGLIERDVLVRGIGGEYGGTNRWRFTWALQDATKFKGAVWGTAKWGQSTWVY